MSSSTTPCWMHRGALCHFGLDPASGRLLAREISPPHRVVSELSLLVPDDVLRAQLGRVLGPNQVVLAPGECSGGKDLARFGLVRLTGESIAVDGHRALVAVLINVPKLDPLP
jgi:hypothetical protein